jgi:hypothetical protein
LNLYKRNTVIEGSLEINFPTIWTEGKAEVRAVGEEKGSEEKKSEAKESVERRPRGTKR